MQTVYTVYFTDGNVVTHLRHVENYTSACENFDETAKIFMKIMYNEDIPYTIRKYEDKIIFEYILYKDTGFPKGIAFAKKLHDVCIYEKTCYAGKVYNTYDVKYIGRIGVLCQTQEIPVQQQKYIDSLKDQLFQKDTLLMQQEIAIERLKRDNERLEYLLSKGNTYSNIDQVSNIKPESADVSLPPPPPPVATIKISNATKRGQIQGDVLEELLKFFSKKKREQQKKEEDDKFLSEMIEEISNFSL